MTNKLRQAARCLALLMLTFATTLQAETATVESYRESHRTQIVREALMSSVNIHTQKRQKSLDVVFSAGKSTKINGMGTGIIIDERGYIVTNFHVVQDVESLKITTFDGHEYTGQVIAFDSHEDLAIIKIDPREQLQVAKIGTSSDIMICEDVIAVGNAYGYESTVTLGVISHKSRDVEVNEEQSYNNLIQIDAAINPGNSGGPLINADGEVIGINVAIRAGAQRIGFAIPIDDARRTIAKLINIEKHHQTYHGVRAVDVKNGRDRKLVVQSTLSGSPAAQAGLQEGDVIVKSGDVDVVDAADLERSLFGKLTGEQVDIVVQRGEDQLTVPLTIASLDPRQNTVRPAPSTTASAPTTFVSSSTSDKAWKLLGMKLRRLSDEISLTGQPYRGGLEVADVQVNGPAYLKGIRKGDILVGLHIWETTSDENLEYVLTHPQLRSIGPLKFYIVRNGETLFGHFPLLLSQR